MSEAKQPAIGDFAPLPLLRLNGRSTKAQLASPDCMFLHLRLLDCNLSTKNQTYSLKLQ